MYRYFEAIFSHKLQILVPIILIPILCLFGALALGNTSIVNATMWVESSSLLPSVSTSYFEANQGPNEKEAATFSELLSTRAFMLELINKAGLEQKVAEGTWPRESFTETTLVKLPVIGSLFAKETQTAAEISQARFDKAIETLRKQMWIGSTGTHVITVSYNGNDPALGVSLVGSAIELYNQHRMSVVKQERESALTFYEAQTKQLQQRVEAASLALTKFYQAHPLAKDEEYQGTEAQQLADLGKEYTLAVSLLDTNETKLHDAQVTSAAEVQKGEADFNVTDQPSITATSTSTTKKLFLFVLVGLVVGLCIGLGSVMVTAFLDTTVRSAQDLITMTKAPVLATVPTIVVPTEKVATAGVLSSSKQINDMVKSVSAVPSTTGIRRMWKWQ